MNLKLDISIAKGYKSKSQIARIITESWVKQNIFCPSCGKENLNDFENNSPVADFYCLECNAEYELKSKKGSSSTKIVNGAYQTMIQRINSENNPSFFILNYSSNDLFINNFLVIPKHYFVDEIIEKRKPLGSSAKRAGWVGCNILLQKIPNVGKIFIVENRKIKPKDEIIKDWNKTSFLANQKKENKGWTIEILKILDKIPEKNFLLNDVYTFENELQEKFPNNNFVKDKIRQQLQVLRDRGLIEFKGRGNYTKI